MKNKITIFMFLVSITFGLVFSSTTVEAATSHANKNWQQSTSRGYLEFSHGGSEQILFEGVATSPGAGTFKVELQRLSFGIWYKVEGSTVYTVKQHSNTTYNVRKGINVNGEYFRLYWPNQPSGRYRFVMHSPSHPQNLGLTHLYY